MRKILFVILPMLCMGFFSCQKELTLTNPAADSTGNGPPGTDGDLLVKVYGKSPNSLDSNVSYYTYNSSKRIASRHYMLYVYSCSTDSWEWYERNTAGLIILSKQYVQASCSPSSLDTVITVHHYTTGSTPMLQSSVQSQDLLGITLADSTVYTYNSAGKVTKTEDYQVSSLLPTSLDSRSVYTYDAAGNVSKIEQYIIAGTVATLAGTQLFEWDSKTDPTGYTDAEALIITGQPAPKHNITKATIVSALVNSTNTYSYKYNSAGKPATSVNTARNTNFPDVITNFTIYYR